MSEFFRTSLFFGAFVSIGAFSLGRWMKKKWKLGIFNPLLVGIVLTIAALLALRVDYPTYEQGARYITYLLTPSTVCLAVPLYERFELLKKNAAALFLGIGAGTLASLLSVTLLTRLFHMDHALYVTLLPKSITTAIGMGLSEELGGYASLTVAAIVITGVTGNITAEAACRLFRITSPMARGVAIGTATHAVGTAKALEMGETEGAMSSLSIVVAGLLTVVGANLCALFW